VVPFTRVEIMLVGLTTFDISFDNVGGESNPLLDMC
jgi:hypothetical protein